jgi:hypothetical protein
MSSKFLQFNDIAVIHETEEENEFTVMKKAEGSPSRKGTPIVLAENDTDINNNQI